MIHSPLQDRYFQQTVCIPCLPLSPSQPVEPRCGSWRSRIEISIFGDCTHWNQFFIEVSMDLVIGIVRNHIARLKVIMMCSIRYFFICLLFGFSSFLKRYFTETYTSVDCLFPFAFAKMCSYLPGWLTAQTQRLERDVSCTPAIASLTCFFVFSASILPKPPMTAKASDEDSPLATGAVLSRLSIASILSAKCCRNRFSFSSSC